MVHLCTLYRCDLRSAVLKNQSIQKPQYSKIRTFEILATFSASRSYKYHRGTTSIFKDDLVRLDNHLFRKLKTIFTTIIFLSFYFQIIFTVTLCLKFLGPWKKHNNPVRVSFFRPYCHTFAECTTTNTEVVEAFWRVIWKCYILHFW